MCTLMSASWFAAGLDASVRVGEAGASEAGYDDCCDRMLSCEHVRFLSVHDSAKATS